MFQLKVRSYGICPSLPGFFLNLSSLHSSTWIISAYLFSSSLTLLPSTICYFFYLVHFVAIFNLLFKLYCIFPLPFSPLIPSPPEITTLLSMSMSPLSLLLSKFRIYFLGQFKAHSKIKGKVQRFLIHPSPPHKHRQPPPLSASLPERVFCYSWRTFTDTLSSPQIRSLHGVHSWCFTFYGFGVSIIFHF